jgi:hypothetical protein
MILFSNDEDEECFFLATKVVDLVNDQEICMPNKGESRGSPFARSELTGTGVLDRTSANSLFPLLVVRRQPPAASENGYPVRGLII